MALNIEKGKTLLLDGAMGTQLMARGVKGCPELWNVEKPDVLTDIAKMYFDAGSDAVETNTFGCSTIRLKSYGLESRSYELSRAGAAAAIAAKPEGKFVFASVGPTGKVFTRGAIPEKEIIEAFEPQLRGVIDAGVDAVLFQTFMDLRELSCAIKALENISGLPYLCSMTFKKTPRGYFTMTGDSIPGAVEYLAKTGASAIGANCGNGIEGITEILAEFRRLAPDANLLGEPNGEYHDNSNKAVIESPEFFVEKMPEVMKCKPAFFGGCCGSTPEHIRGMRKFLDSKK
jgi:5-methyltetrahydrofolate--homocysteine methyltransferase